MVDDLQDPRRTEPPTGEVDERRLLEGWLEYHRTTLLLKVEGIDDQTRKARPVPTSLLSLHGLVRHMADVERSWFRRRMLGQTDLPFLFYDGVDEDSDLFPLDHADWDHDLAAWREECESSRQATAGLPLDQMGVTHGGEPLSLRWVYLHMIEEYARHNGHADLIRELVDGEVGC